MAKKALRFKQTAAQGELGIMRLPDSYPIPMNRPKAKAIRAGRKSVLVIGHSETGHHHVMDAEKVEAYDLPNESKMLVVHQPTELTHMRDYDTHTPLAFEPGKYLVKTLQEFDMLKQQAVLSRD